MIKIGSLVTWNSQSHGIPKDKVGIVVARVPEGSIPIVDDQPAKWLRLSKEAYRFDKLGGGSPRSHDSFLIAVPQDNKTAKPLLYWPRVVHLDNIKRRRLNDQSH